MLTLTDAAATVVKSIIAQTPDASEGGLRISASEPGLSDLSLAVAVAVEPEPSDTVIEESGARVYLEPNAAVALDDKVLDAEIDEAGAARFSVVQG